MDVLSVHVPALDNAGTTQRAVTVNVNTDAVIVNDGDGLLGGLEFTDLFAEADLERRRGGQDDESLDYLLNMKTAELAG